MKSRRLWQFLPFWLFLMFFKLGAALHFDSMSPLGERVLPIWIVGLVIGLASFIQMLLDVPAGFLLDKFGYRRLLKLTTVIFIFATSFMFFGLSQWTYSLTLFLGCLGWLFFGPGVNAYVLSHSSSKDAGRFMSLRVGFDSLGVVIASVFFAMLINLSVQMLATVVIIFLAIAYVLISFAPEDVFVVKDEKKLPTQNYYIKRQFLHKVIKIIVKLNPASMMLLLTGLSTSIFYAIIWFVIPLVIAHSGHPGVMAWGLGIFDLAIVFVGFALGKLTDRINKKILIFAGLLVASIAGMLLGFSFGILFILIGFIASVGNEIASLSLWSWLYALDKEHAEDGLVSGVINLFQNLGWAIGPVLGGFLYDILGASWTIMIGGVSILVVWGIFSVRMGSSYHTLSLEYGSVPRKPHNARSKS